MRTLLAILFSIFFLIFSAVVIVFLRDLFIIIVHNIRKLYITDKDKTNSVILKLENKKSEKRKKLGRFSLKRIIPDMCPKCFKLMYHMEYPFFDEFFECKCGYKIFYDD